ncbi:MAG: hypothetical protein KY464_08825 [Gemmatimonadetes bacterium]|nr:hypothetical protein [Gemmatimonadota bacterium]
MSRRRASVAALFLALLTTSLALPLHAQNPPAPAPAAPAANTPAPAAAGEKIRVFLDCQRCDSDYLRTEIQFVDYMRDRTDADVHILVTTQQTGAGGLEYTFRFVGQRQFEGITEDLRFASSPNDSQDQVRQGIARVLRAGLVRYAARTPMLDRLQLSFGGPAAGAARAAAPGRDRWNRWVFRTSLSGSTNAESSYESRSWSASASANRTTADWKHVFSLFTRSSQSEFEVGPRTVTNRQSNRNGSVLSVRSISDHWSVGGRTNANSSTFLNRDLALRAAPAIEYNFFPYSQSTRRQLTLQYSPGVNQIAYNEETIFGKVNESLLDQSLTASYNMTQRWGTVRVSVEGLHYFHDPSKYHVNSFGNLDLRLIKGVSLTFFGQADRIRDQLHLAKGNLTPEQILLRQRQISTSFQYYAQVGLSYSFGSIFSPVVNPRMGNSGGGGVIFFN